MGRSEVTRGWGDGQEVGHGLARSGPFFELTARTFRVPHMRQCSRLLGSDGFLERNSPIIIPFFAMM